MTDHDFVVVPCFPTTKPFCQIYTCPSRIGLEHFKSTITMLFRNVSFPRHGKTVYRHSLSRVERTPLAIETKLFIRPPPLFRSSASLAQRDVKMRKQLSGLRPISSAAALYNYNDPFLRRSHVAFAFQFRRRRERAKKYSVT